MPICRVADPPASFKGAFQEPARKGPLQGLATGTAEYARSLARAFSRPLGKAPRQGPSARPLRMGPSLGRVQGAPHSGPQSKRPPLWAFAGRASGQRKCPKAMSKAVSKGLSIGIFSKGPPERPSQRPCGPREGALLHGAVSKGRRKGAVSGGAVRLRGPFRGTVLMRRLDLPFGTALEKGPRQGAVGKAPFFRKGPSKKRRSAWPLSSALF
ncbi:hypothetical protein M885DRAFT_292765 [Pelagophyceae sp. CCMP2097]|nr:hypothetical protein M885DRAFT_292765 [Pelagophyceae sp. CCMP2097]